MLRRTMEHLFGERHFADALESSSQIVSHNNIVTEWSYEVASQREAL